MGIQRKAAIVGLAEMAPQKTAGDKTPLSIIATVAREAIADAGLEKKEIDGLLTATSLFEQTWMWPTIVADYLHLQPRYANVVDLGGASAAGMVWRAAAAVEAGMCETVLCVMGATWDAQTLNKEVPWVSNIEREFDLPYGLIGANPGYGLIARRHMHEFGTTPEQMAKVAVDQRSNACKNPLALFGRKPLTIDEVLRSRTVVEPLHLLEIVSPCTGGAAFIVTSAERAKRGPHRPVYLIGAGEAVGHTSITHAKSLTTSMVKPAAEAAFKMAGLSPEYMDFVQPYDCYTIAVIITLEDAGFCRKGEGGRFVAEHDLTYRGDFPCNTHGGQLSFGQPGLAGGMSHVIEGARQLMGRAGERQVKDATLGYINGNGGFMSEECSLILGIQ